MSELLHVENRKTIGKRNNERLRRAGRLPAVLYGHGEEAVSLTLAADQLEASLRHGAKVVDLDGAASGKALLQDIQWDTFFQHVLHVDLLRVRAGEKVKIDVPIELRGEAPGSRDGGLIEQMVHSIEIEVALDVIPDKLHININHLEIGGQLTANDIEDLAVQRMPFRRTGGDLRPGDVGTQKAAEPERHMGARARPADFTTQHESRP